MFCKIIILSLALLLEVTYAQQCLNISGECVGGTFCPPGEQCINGVCCTTDAAANCANVLPDALCDGHAAQCTDATLKDAMAKQCPRTCKTCGGATSGANSTTAAPGTATTAPGGAPCVDKVGPSGTSDCVKDAYLCNNAQYYDLMTQQCPKTCGRCSGSSSSGSGSPASSTCVDKVGPSGTSDCAKDAYLCNNAQYYDLMTQQCPKTCGRC